MQRSERTQSVDPRGNIWKRKGTVQSFRFLLRGGVGRGGTSNPIRRAFREGAIPSAVDSIIIEFLPKSKLFSWQCGSFWVVPLPRWTFVLLNLTIPFNRLSVVYF